MKKTKDYTGRRIGRLQAIRSTGAMTKINKKTTGTKTKENNMLNEFDVYGSYDIIADGISVDDVIKGVNDYVVEVLERNGFKVMDEDNYEGDDIASSHFDSEWFDMAIRMYGEDALTGKVEVLENMVGTKRWLADVSIYMTYGDDGIHGKYEFDHEPTNSEIFEAITNELQIGDYDDFEMMILTRCVHDYRVTKKETKG